MHARRFTLLLAACGLASCGHHVCDIDQIAAELAGEGAEDCGIGGPENLADVDACAVAAFREARPFYAIFPLQGIDSVLTAALASDGAATWSLVRDSDPSGGSNVGAVVHRIDCDAQIEVGDAGHEQITCPATTASCVVCGGDRDDDRCE